MRSVLRWLIAGVILGIVINWAYERFRSGSASYFIHHVSGEYIGEHRTERGKVIVFVHGVTGSAKETWTFENPRTKRTVYWPQLMRDAPGYKEFYNDYNIYVVDYPTTLTKKDPSLVDLALGLNERLEQAGILPEEAGAKGSRSSNEIIFLGHSMGNLVVRTAMMIDGRYNDHAVHVPLVLSVAAPSNGSAAAEFANLWSKNPQYTAMLNIQNNPFLQLLNGIWKHNPPTETEIACAYENEPMPGTRLLVVERHSAVAVCSRKDLQAIKANHSSISKPESEEAQIHQWVTTQIRKERSSTLVKTPERWKNRSVVVGGKDFLESNVLAAIMAFTINSKFRESCPLADATCYAVEMKYHIGGRDRTYEELVRGDIDLYPEYTGTLLANFPDLSFGLSFDEVRNPEFHDPVRINQLLLARKHLSRFEVLDRFALKSDYQLIIRRAKAIELGLPMGPGEPTLSALVERSAGKQLRFSSTPDFFYRPDGIRGLREHYAVMRKGVTHKFDFSAIAYTQHDDKYKELQENKTDVVDAYKTDAELFVPGQQLFVELHDDRRFFPKYEAMPLVNRQLLQEHKFLRNALSRLRGKVTTAEIADILAAAKILGIKSDDLQNSREKQLQFEALVKGFMVKWGLLLN